jgi:predicted TIM-barrel fold metal-dependent hydrolase
MVVVDSHVHLLPGRLGEKVRAYFAPLAEHLVYPTDHDVVRRRLADDGVDRAWTLPYAHKPGVADWLNAATAEIVAGGGPVDLVGGCTVHPGDDDPGATFARALDDHGLQVLKLHCSVGDYEADDPRLDGVWALAGRRRIPVVVHAGHATDGRTEGYEVAPIGRVAARHPDVPLIIAHCAHPETAAALDLVEAHPNVHADLTPVLLVPPDLPDDRVGAVADRLLFGSDAPNTGITAGDHRRWVESLPLAPATIAAITGGTAERLLAASS